MTGDGGEYLRAEDLRELGDDSLPGQYLDGMNYLRFSLEGGRTDRYRSQLQVIYTRNCSKTLFTLFITFSHFTLVTCDY